jgi:hypothetical protein
MTETNTPFGPSALHPTAIKLMAQASRLVRIARGLHDVTKGGRAGKVMKRAVQNYAQELFTMAEEVLGQQVPPLPRD